NSAVAALDALVERGARTLTFICLIAAPEGVRHVQRAHPSASIVTCAVDAGLNDHAYIVPGLGDAGDRMFGSLTSVPAAVRSTS
ncbi:MAG: uracil phosphoribosyltransferase, partial [Candidatus Tyrphobacter sp.]